MDIKIAYDYIYRFIIYGCIHLLTDFLLTNIFSKKVIQQLDKNDRIDLGEKVSSAVNGIITGVISIYVMFYQNAFKGDVYTPYNEAMDNFFKNLVAYSVYDLVVMYLKPKEEFSFWVHHFVVLIGSYLAPVYKAGCFFPIIFGITELTVITNNFVWYLQRLQYKNTELYENALFLRALVFTLVRPFCGVYAIYYAIYNPGILPENELIENLNFFQMASISLDNFFKMPLVPRILNFICPAMLALLNIAWTYVILVNYMKKSKTKVD